MPATTQEMIAGLYVAFYNRAPDKAGLAYWKNRASIGNELDVFSEIAVDFATHPQFSELYNTLDNQQFVEAIYVNVLGFSGDHAGITYWAQAIDNGISRPDMVVEFIYSALNADLEDVQWGSLTGEERVIAQNRQDTLLNKVETALYFVDSFDDATNITNPDDLESDPAYLASIEILANINHTSALAIASRSAVKLDSAGILVFRDVDITAPEFTSGAIASAINENSGALQVIYTAETTDDNTVTYSLESNSDSALLSIDSETGEVTLKADPSYESKTSYVFTVIAIDAANNSSEQAVTLPILEVLEVDPSIVVFDLLQGVSSNHSEREFDSSVSYDIYIQVSSGGGVLNIPREESDTWGVWHAWDKLSSDDHIIFVGSDGIILGEENLPVVKYAQFENTYFLQTATFTAIAFNVNGNLSRVVNDYHSSATLGDNVLVTHSISQLPVVNLTEMLTQRPEAIWGTQGLL